MPDHPDCPCCRVSRRDVLKQALATGAAFALPMLATSAEAKSTWQTVGKASAFKVNVPSKVTLPNKLIVYVTRLSGNRFSALSSRCTHAGCPVNWDGGKKLFVCPCHGATFSPAGKNLSGPARSPLAVLPVGLKGGNVVIDTSAPAAAAPPPRGRRGDHERGEHEGREHEGGEHEGREHEGREHH